jgi:hypothetical protein
MSNAAAADIVSLDDYRRSRGERRMPESRHQANRVTYTQPAVWVYWVPVWVW